MNDSLTKKIFIVDDDIVYQEILKHELQELDDIEVEAFSSAESCLEQMYKRPDLVILDYYLDSLNKDNMNGHYALDRFRDKKPNQKILFISRQYNRGILEEYEKYRIADFVVKTKNGSKHLLSKVRQLLAA